MNTKKVVEIAIKRHDIDADHFQDVYTDKTKAKGPFLLGRELVLEELFKALKELPKGSKILDVGCGTGHLTKLIQEKGFEVYGIEPSSEMLKYANQNFPGIDIKYGISSALPFKDNSFDFILAFEVLRYLNKEENINSYNEFKRTLKPNGSFFVTHVNLFATDFYYFFHQVKAVIYKIIDKTHHYCNFTTTNRETDNLQKLGFKDIKTIGVFAATTRIAYKFGNKIGSMYYNITQNKLKLGKFKNNFRKNLAGHLIVIAKKD